MIQSELNPQLAAIRVPIKGDTTCAAEKANELSPMYAP